jgi:signal peptidase I
MRFPFSIFRVSGHSMEPFLHPGDLVLVWQWGKIGVGDVVVFEMSAKGEVKSKKSEFWVKRIKKVESEKWKVKSPTQHSSLSTSHYFFVEGDNKNDSLGVQPLKREQILGKVVRLGYGRRKRGLAGSSKGPDTKNS